MLAIILAVIDTELMPLSMSKIDMRILFMCKMKAFSDHVEYFTIHSVKNDCLVDVDGTTDTPCVNGYCVDGANTFFCQCFTGWTGSHCDIQGIYELLLTMFILSYSDNVPKTLYYLFDPE